MNLFVTNLPRECTEDELKAHFEACGEVKTAKIIMDRDTGRPRGFGFVLMADADGGQRAIDELDGQAFGGRDLIVKEAQDKERRPSRSGGFEKKRW